MISLTKIDYANELFLKCIDKICILKKLIWNIRDISRKKFSMKKNRVSRPVQTKKCLKVFFFHTEVLKAYIVLKTLLLKVMFDLPETF